ncbi:CLUMA_CG019236, isoform A [Clunio marinus]|uniref:CLUMA_CG019236, isoform A n=1 Tax=Clunio marinus TaxID=568069 RepID=A0A1J1J2T0_9DIPT|nr:CLUMA_CG019236, isoform A [Clunio marinus]
MYFLRASLTTHQIEQKKEENGTFGDKYRNDENQITPDDMFQRFSTQQSVHLKTESIKNVLGMLYRCLVSFTIVTLHRN